MEVREATREVRLAHWREIIRGQRESGQSIRAYCRAQGVHEKSYYYWQRRLREAVCAALPARQEVAMTFTQLVPQEQCTEETTLGKIIIRLGKAEVEIIGEVSQSTLERVLRSVSAIC